MKYFIGALIGAAVFVIVPETARWVHGGAFAQVPSSAPPGPPSVNCQNNIGGDNSAPLNNNCGNTYYGPPRVPNGLYQNGERIGIVEGFTVSPDNKSVTFHNLPMAGSVMNLKNYIEIQNVLVSCPTLFNIPTGAVQTSILINGDTICDIVGVRQ